MNKPKDISDKVYKNKVLPTMQTKRASPDLSVNHRVKCDEYNRAWLKMARWSLSNRGYVIRRFCIRGKCKTMQFHNIIMWAPRGMFIDHINGDPLDNRYENLRIVTPHQNIMNQGLRSNNKSGHKGVKWDKRIEKWCASIGYNYKNIYLGSFDKKEDAVNARQTAEKEYYGEYRRK